MKKVLILGGGFAGLEAAIFLRKKKIDVTLISDRDYFYIFPTSIWVPTSEVKFEDICVDLYKLSKVHGFELVIDKVQEIVTKEEKIVCANSTYNYEYLVVAIGSGKMKHVGGENTLSICGVPTDSIKMKERIDELIQVGSGKVAMGFGGNPKDTSNVRGGPAFEVMFNLHNQLKKLGIRDKFELTFFAPMDKPGAKMGPKALKMMDIIFNKLDIKKHFGKKIKRFESDGIIFEDDSKLDSDFTMFIPAGDGHEVIKNSDLPLNNGGFVKINDYCEVEDIKNVFAIGDSAALEGPEWRAKQGHVAEVMARNVAFNINSMEKGSSKRKGYQEHINILCVMDTGNGAAFVYRNTKSANMIPMPFIGHLLKKGWGWYCKNSKLGKIPRIPGM
jgi:sulfide:quinone oxidoreductase